MKLFSQKTFAGLVAVAFCLATTGSAINLYATWNLPEVVRVVNNLGIKIGLIASLMLNFLFAMASLYYLKQQRKKPEETVIESAEVAQAIRELNTK